jgi:uncharacterized protein YraI
LFSVVAISLACSSQVTVIPTSPLVNAETLVAETMAVYTEKAPSATSTFVPTLAAFQATPTMVDVGDVPITTMADNVNLRVNPGMLFQVSRVLPIGTVLQFLGYAPGGEWVRVVNDEGIAGWVNTNVVEVNIDLRQHVIEPTDVILVTGFVMTELGTPVSGVGFDVSQGSRSTSATTDLSGQFFAYLPRNMSGTWTVRYSSISCTSNTMDVNCNCIGGRCGSAYPASATVNLPQTEPLNFVWK